MIQLKIFSKIQEQLKKEKFVSGIMLMGSVAQNNASAESDLDIMVLSNENSFKTEICDGVLVEYIFTTFDTRLQKLINNEMEVYHFINNKIIYDKDNQLHYLMEIAIEKYNNFTTEKEIKAQIYHWLFSTKIKLLSAIKSSNILKQNYIVSTNSWKIIEAIYAINDKPVPPSSAVIRLCDKLENIPYKNWFETLFIGNDNSKVNAMINIIEWILPQLNFSL